MERQRISIFSYSFFYPIPLALTLLIIRELLERHVFIPIGIKFGINPPNIYREVKIPHQNKVLNINLASSSNFFNNKYEKNDKIYRFSRSCWHFLYYFIEFMHGLYILMDKTWMYNIKECWTDYPTQKVTYDLWLYYVVNLGYFWSLLIKLFVHKRRKDFTESFIHHSLAVLLIYISFVTNSVRIGTLVIVVLFASDIFLELAKISKYLKLENQATFFFINFVLVWTITRMIIYPFWILKHTLMEVPEIITMTPSSYLLNVLLCAIAVLNIFWTLQIYKIVWKVLRNEELNDDRSDDENNEEIDANKEN